MADRPRSSDLDERVLDAGSGEIPVLSADFRPPKRRALEIGAIWPDIEWRLAA